MADNNLNPGQQHYEDTYGQYGRIRDIEDRAASGYEHDYSSPTDRSVGINNSPIQDHNNVNGASDNFLNNAEQDMASQSPISSSRDLSLGQQERSTSHQTSGFSNSQSPISGHQKARLSGFKKKAIAAGIALFAGGGLFFGIFTALSGPVQLIQAAELIKDFQINISAAQQTARSMNSTRKIANLAANGGDTLASNVRASRLGILGNKQADAMIERMSEQGVTFNSNKFGSQNGMTIDVYKAFGLDDDEIDLDQLAERIGVSRDKIDIGDTPGTIELNDKLSYSEAKRAVQSVDDPGKWSLRSWLQTRLTLKKVGYTSWLHPIEKATSKTWKNITDFIENVITKKILKPDNMDSRSVKNAEEDSLPGSEDQDRPGSPSSDANDLRTRFKNAVGSGVEKARGVYQQITDFQDYLTNFKGFGVINLALSVFCGLNDVYDNAGPYKQTNIVNVAEKGSSLVMGLGSQVQSGTDIDINTAGLAVKSMLGDNVDVLDGSGNKTGKKKFSSFWDAKPICTTLGTVGCSKHSDLTPLALLNLTRGGVDFFPDVINDALQAAFKGPFAIFFDGVCQAFGWFSIFLDGITGFIQDQLTSFLMDTILNTNLGARFASMLTSFFFGTPLDLESLVPEEWGSVGMYGGKLTSNDQAIRFGGYRQTRRSAIELNLEQRRYLAWENSQKPVLARLLNPTDYNSSVNQIARSIRIDSSSQDFGTQLANVFKVFTSAPTILASASNQLLGGSAYAAAASYDYGFDTYAYSVSDMDTMLNDDSYSIYENADKVLGWLQAEDEKEKEMLDNGKTPDPWGDLPYHTYAQKCLLSDIGNKSSGYKVDSIDNEDGTSWNYVDMNNSSYQDAIECNNRSAQDEYKRLGIYIMDYHNTVAGMCYEGSEDDSDSQSACSEMGVEDGGSSSHAGASSFSEDIETMLGQFESDTGNTGDWDGAYGRQCVDMSVWFLDNFTTLTHASNNGNQFVNSLVAANPQLTITSTPEAPAFFSVNCYDTPAMTSNCAYGHTGVVLQVDADGTIHTLENSGSLGTSYTMSWTPEQYAGALFVNVGDYLK